MRINQYLARCGVASRRGADKLIESGEVYIDGRVAVPGDQVDNESNVTVSGKAVRLPDEHIVMAYYKPVGVTCTEKDEHADRIITDEVRSDRRLTYAGRLDKDSEGLIIMTDDGILINAMMRGSSMHEKEYEVSVDTKLTDKQIMQLREGIYIEELDATTRPCKVKRTGNNTFNIILTQGLNRQIRRMCYKIGCNVMSIKRTRVMNIRLGDLQVGASRNLTDEEKSALYRACGLHI